ncbi:hypothetical protein [Hymenobacter jeollabukensis]|uniref:SH3 domain-containing protein n=1 Tax=Hymenobacter jeollabukensis TaxID=2025313 RepID=A0A5R8WS82_9BACT|nr:hypothetical protein [Hymenobacter jeollabukensis]TLM94054.1 hypothetical protein FDY95_08485 [Hymenobacter jeollabukensis]
MPKTLLFLALLGLAACSAAKDDSASNRSNNTPVARNTVVDCPLYDGMKKESTQLMAITSGTEVQVMDTVDQYFVKVRATNAGKTETGYMYRTCFKGK